MQPYSGRVGLVVTRRVPGSAAVQFYEWSAPLVHPLYTIGNRKQPQRILNRPRHAGNAACRLDYIQPLLLLSAQPAGWSLHLDAGEHRHLLADHLRCDGDALPADQISAALAQAKLHWAAILITQSAGVVAEEPGITIAAGDADLLLDLLFRHLLAGARVPMVWQPPAALPHYLRL